MTLPHQAAKFGKRAGSTGFTAHIPRGIGVADGASILPHQTTAIGEGGGGGDIHIDICQPQIFDLSPTAYPRKKTAVGTSAGTLHIDVEITDGMPAPSRLPVKLFPLPTGSQPVQGVPEGSSPLPVYLAQPLAPSPQLALASMFAPSL